jgi:hypothetical protein
MWKNERQYYDVIRVKKRRRGRDLYDWIRLLGMGVIALLIVGYVVKLYVFPADPVVPNPAVIYLPWVMG